MTGSKFNYHFKCSEIDTMKKSIAFLCNVFSVVLQGKRKKYNFICALTLFIKFGYFENYVSD